MLTLDTLRYELAQSMRLCRSLLFGCALVLLGHDASAGTREPVHFEIAAQTIVTALDAYSAATQLEIFYDGEVAIGRRSSAVKGSLPPDEALRELLAGSGLVARVTGQNSFTIVSAPPRATSASYQSYFAAIQARVSQALCARAQIRSVDEDLLIRLWITTSGTVQQVQLVDAPDDRAPGSALTAVLRGLAIDATPPAGMPQPVMMAILARTKDEPSGCANTKTGSR